MGFLEKDLEKLSVIVDKYMADRSLGSVDDVMNVRIFFSCSALAR